MNPSLTLTPALARRLFIIRQRLAGPRASATPEGIMEVARDLGCLQLDPTSAVARSHLLVLWSRLGRYELDQLDQVMWQERHLFEYWAHCASLVLTEEFPIHSARMRGYPAGHSGWAVRSRAWMKENDKLRRHILTRLKRDGPLLARELEADGVDPVSWVSSGWNSGRNVSLMLDMLLMQGKLMVAGRVGGQKQWDLAERCLPEWTPREKWSEDQVVYHATQKSLRALGVATARQITQHYIRGRYPGLKDVLQQLVREGRIVPVKIEDAKTKGAKAEAWKGEWFIHAEDVPLLESLRAGVWQPRTTLLSPFDNLICDRARTEAMFNFNFRIEIYVPAPKRQYGYFVLPILHGDRLIGRIDPLMDRAHRCFIINNIYAEPDAPMNRETAIAVRSAIAELGAFLGATEIAYVNRQQMPQGWKPWLK